jgi:Cu(I)/Ag(I) efflux system membrane protein CusA/SilA
MLGGMLTAPLLSLFIVPAVYLLLRRRSGPSQQRNSDDTGPLASARPG